MKVSLLLWLLSGLNFYFLGKTLGQHNMEKKIKCVRKKLVANLNCNLNLVLFYIKINVHIINSKDIILYKNKGAN